MGRKRRMKAEDFGDDPNIRRKYGEAEQINVAEPWETRYAEQQLEVKYEDELWRVVKTKGEKARIKNLKTGKSKWVPIKELSKAG